MEPNDNKPTMILVFGILGLVACQIFAPIAWYMGSAYKREAILEGREVNQLAQVGQLLGIIGTGLLLLVAVLMSIIVVLQLVLVFAL